MAAITVAQRQSVVLPVNWAGYVAIGEAVRDRPIRMTYYRGRLEIMVNSLEHEWANNLLARIVEALTEELNIDIHSGGSTTFRDEELDAGLEPDECYWIEHEEQMR